MLQQHPEEETEKRSDPRGLRFEAAQHSEQHGTAVMLITHDMEIMASECSRALIMGNQTVAFDGSPEELFKKSMKRCLMIGLDRDILDLLTKSKEI